MARLLAACLLAALAATHAGPTTTIWVNAQTGNDGGGNCGISAGSPCATLSAALTGAAGMPTPATVVIQLAAGAPGTVYSVPETVVGSGRNISVVGALSSGGRMPVIGCTTPAARAFTVTGTGILGLLRVTVAGCGGKAVDAGGAIKLQDSATVTLQQAALLRNTAQNGGAVFITRTSSTAVLRLVGTSVSHNVALGSATVLGDGGAINMQDASGGTVILDSCVVSNNTASHEGGGLYADSEATLYISSSQITSNHAGTEGGFASFRTTKCNITIVGTTVANNTAKLDSGAIGFEGGGSVSITNSKFLSNNISDPIITNPAIINVMGSLQLTIDGSTFQSHSDASALWILLLASGSYVSNSQFIGNRAVTGPAVWLTGTASLWVDRTTFRHNVAISNGGAVAVSDQAVLNCTRCTFDANYANSIGGAIACEGDGQIVLSDKTTFSRCRAVRGGAVYMTSSCVFVYANMDATFSNNAADWGGAIYTDHFNIKKERRTAVPAAKMQFISNSAVFAGSAFYYFQEEGIPTKCPRTILPSPPGQLVLSGNSAAGKADHLTVATSPSYMSSSVAQGTVVWAQSGKVITPAVSVALVDACSQDLSSTFPGFIALASVNDQHVTISGGLATGNGFATFPALQLNAKPNSVTTLQINSTAPAALAPISIQVRLRPCTVGQSLSSQEVCETCPQGQYSLTNSSKCLPCTRFGICPGGDVINGLRDYGRLGTVEDASGYVQPIFAACPFPAACEGPQNTTDTTPNSCQKGYTGYLCSECQPHWSRLNTYECSECPSAAMSVFGTIGQGVVGLVLFLATIHRLRTSGLKEVDFLTQAGKVLTSYFQLVSIANSLNSLWPPAVAYLFRGQQLVSSSGTSSSFFDCFLQDQGMHPDADNNFYYTTVVYILAIPAVSLVAAIVWGIVALARYYHPTSTKTAKYLIRSWRTNCIVTAIIIMFYMYPSVSTQILQLFACQVAISDPAVYGDVLSPVVEQQRVQLKNDYLIADPHIQCYTAEHNAWMAGAGTFGVVFIVIGAPVIVFFVLWRMRDHLHLQLTRSKYGALYSGYSAQCYYWEAVLLARKTAVIAATQLLAQFGRTIQVVAAITVLFIAYIHHLHSRPFDDVVLDRMEKFSLTICLFTFSLSTLLAANVGLTVQVVVVVLVILINVVYLCYIAYQLRYHVVGKVLDTVAQGQQAVKQIAEKNPVKQLGRRGSVEMGGMSSNMTEEEMDAEAAYAARMARMDEEIAARAVRSSVHPPAAGSPAMGQRASRVGRLFSVIGSSNNSPKPPATPQQQQQTRLHGIRVRANTEDDEPGAQV